MLERLKSLVTRHRETQTDQVSPLKVGDNFVFKDPEYPQDVWKFGRITRVTGIATVGVITKIHQGNGENQATEPTKLIVANGDPRITKIPIRTPIICR